MSRPAIVSLPRNLMDQALVSYTPGNPHLGRASSVKDRNTSAMPGAVRLSECAGSWQTGLIVLALRRYSQDAITKAATILEAAPVYHDRLLVYVLAT